MKRMVAALLTVALTACASGSDESDGTVSGTLVGPSGAPVDITVVEGDSLNYSGAACIGTAQESVLDVVLSDRGGVCNGFQNSSNVANSTVLIMSIAGSPANSSSPPPAIAANNYPVSNPFVDPSGNIFATSSYVFLFDTNCGNTKVAATSGSIVVSSISGGVATGTFDLTYGSSGELTGSFSAPECQLSAVQFCAVGTATSCGG